MPKLAHQVGEYSERRKTSYSHVISSTMSGTIARTATHPLERLRIMQQLSQPGYRQGNTIITQLAFMYRKEGARGLFKGNAINCVGAAPFTALEFFLYEFFKNNLWPDIQYKDLTLKHKMVCGAVAGICAQSLLNPLDVVKTHYTIEQRPDKSAASLVIDKAQMVWRKEGPRGFLKGNILSTAGVAPFVALRQSLFDFQTNTLSHHIFSPEDITNQAPRYLAYEVCSGASSGFVAISICYPFDILRRMMQLNGLQKQHQYNGHLDLFQQVYRRDGMGGFYKGFLATCMKVIPTTAILFFLNDKIKKQLMSREELMSCCIPIASSSDSSEKNES